MQYCLEENSLTEVLGRKVKQVHTDLNSIIWEKEAMNKGLFACSFHTLTRLPPLHAPLGLEGELCIELLGLLRCCI